MSIVAAADTRTIADLVHATGLPADADLRNEKLLPGLTTRARNCMLRYDICTIGELAQQGELDLLDIRYFGSFSLNNLRTVLAEVADWPAWRKEIAHLAGALSDGYDADRINNVLGRLSDLPMAPGYLVCVWAGRDEYGYCGDSQLYVDANNGGGVCEISGDLWEWLSQEPGTSDSPVSPGDPATWKGCLAGFGLEGLAVDDGLHNFARTAS